MIIDIHDIVNYCSCPSYYKFNLNNDNNIEDINILFDEVIHSTLYSFFKLCKTKNKLISLKKLNQIFINKWMGNNIDFKDVIYTESNWRDFPNEKRKLALFALYNFYKLLKRINFKVLAVDTKYKIEIAKGLYVTGTIELVLQITDEHGTYINLFDFKTNSRINNIEYADRDYEVSCALYAFESMFNIKVNNCILYGINRSKTFYTKRNKDFLEQSFKDIATISKLIYNNIFYNNPSERCNKCKYKILCTK